MARSKSLLQVQVEYSAFALLTRFIRAVPVTVGTWISFQLLRLVFGLMAKRRRLVLKNIADSFPQWSASQVQQTYLASLKYLARGIAFTVLLTEWTTTGRYEWIDIEGLEHLEAALLQGKGVLAFTAHYGCWEWMSARMMALYPQRVAVVYRAMDNPRIDQTFVEWRTAAGGQVVERHQLIRQGIRWLQGNRIIGILMDQNFADGLFLPFLGRTAATVPIVSMIARRTGAIVLPLHNYWEGDRLKIVWGPPLTLSKNANREEAVREDTQQMSEEIERWIRKDPAQWFWLHNRWKHQPQESQSR